MLEGARLQEQSWREKEMLVYVWSGVVQEIEQVFVTVPIRAVTLCQHFTQIIISDDLVSLSVTAVFSLEATELPWGGVRGVI